MGEGEGGGEWLIRTSPSPQSSPTGGEEITFKAIPNRPNSKQSLFFEIGIWELIWDLEFVIWDFRR